MADTNITERAAPQSAMRHHTHGSVASYSIGFILSVVLTLVAYMIVSRHLQDPHGTLSAGFVIGAITALAAGQLLVQLLFFLHMASEKKPRWNLIVFCFMLLILGIVVGGSLWIMHNLNYHMMPPEQMDKHMLHEAQKGF